MTPSSHRRASPVRRRVDSTLSATELLRGFRDKDGLVGLIGAWGRRPGDDGDAALIAFEPAEVLAPEQDPFEVLARSTGTDGTDGTTFGGGWIGLWGYQLGARIERLPAPPRRDRPQPDFHLAFYDSVLRLDSADRTWWFESIAPPDRADEAHAAVLRRLETLDPAGRDYRCGEFEMVPGADQHRAAVAAALEHIVAGDIFQANVCLRLESTFDGDPLDLFCAGAETLRPAYAAYLHTGDRAVASFSPELFLRRTGRDVLTSPIKGTAPLTDSADELASSAKNRAENIMIVDLMRNDLGRVCVPGSITASATARPRRHTGVWHLVSDVVGELREGTTDADLLRSTFPPGSVTGAPKVSAMEVIAELEATGRELYTGAIGYVSPFAGLEMSVVIRTFEFAGDRVWLGVGGGIVADSTPDAELRECFVKAEPLLRAVGGRLAPGLAPDRPAEAEHCRPAFAGADSVARPDPRLGIFDTLLVQGGIAVDAEGHVERLSRSAEAVYGANPALDVTTLLDRVRETAATLPGLQRLRLTTDGAGVAVEAVSIARRPREPLRLTPHVIPGGIGPHKWNDRRLIETLTGPAATDEPLLVDAGGSLLETGRGNVFVVTDDGVHTPPIDGRILAGVTRSTVLAMLRENDVPVHEHAISLSDLADAAEVFVTNAIGGVRPVVACTGTGAWPIGRATRWLAECLEARWSGRSTASDPAPRRHEDAVVLLIDNYDSFVYNLAQYVAELGATAVVARNDELSIDEITHMQAVGDFTHVILSPGPGTPADAGVCNDVVARLGALVPILGVCLGHQCIGEVCGGRVVRAPAVVHGKPSLIHHDGQGVYAGLAGPLVSARYHSLVVTDLPESLEATAHTAAGVVMGIRHRTDPVEGVQMHPESILTPRGHLLISNFLARTTRPS